MPHTSKDQSKRRHKRLYVVGGMVGIVAITLAVTPKPAVLPDAAVDKLEHQSRQTEAAALYDAKATITSMMKDPTSAVISEGSSRTKHGQIVSCGWVNGRNGFGAMSGNARWVVIPGKNVAIIQNFENEGKVAQLWNRYCVGDADAEKPAPTEFVGVKIGAHMPATLHPFDAAGQVFVYRDAAPHAYLGVPVVDPYYTAEHGRIDSGGATAKGVNAYHRLRKAMFDAFGMPSEDSGDPKPQMRWSWGDPKVVARLSYNPDHDQTTVSVERQ